MGLEVRENNMDKNLLVVSVSLDNPNSVLNIYASPRAKLSCFDVKLDCIPYRHEVGINYEYIHELVRENMQSQGYRDVELVGTALGIKGEELIIFRKLS